MHQITLSCLNFIRKRFKLFLINDPKSSSRQPNIKMVDILKYKLHLLWMRSWFQHIYFSVGSRFNVGIGYKYFTFIMGGQTIFSLQGVPCFTIANSLVTIEACMKLWVT